MSMPLSGERVAKWMLAQRVHSGQVNAMALRANVIPGGTLGVYRERRWAPCTIDVGASRACRKPNRCGARR